MSDLSPSTPSSSPSNKRRQPSAPQIAGLVALILLLVFIFENTRRVRMRFIIPEIEAPLYVALLLAAVVGALAMWLIQWRLKARKK